MEGDPLSLTTWYRGYVQWKAGGVVPPLGLKRPFMLAKDAGKRLTEKERERWLRTADDALKAPVRADIIRHGYPINYKCPDHKSDLERDLVNFRRRQAQIVLAQLCRKYLAKVLMNQ